MLRREREIIYLSLHCHHQNDSCIKTGSDESHFNLSLIVMDKVTRQCPKTKNLFKENGEPKRNRADALNSAYQPNACPLGPNRLTWILDRATHSCMTIERPLPSQTPPPPSLLPTPSSPTPQACHVTDGSEGND